MANALGDRANVTCSPAGWLELQRRIGADTLVCFEYESCIGCKRQVSLAMSKSLVYW